MTLSPAFLDELRARTGLSSLIQRKVKLTKAGTDDNKEVLTTPAPWDFPQGRR